MSGSTVSMDLDEFLSLVDDDGHISPSRLPQKPNVDENECKVRKNISSDLINQDISLNFRRNEDLLEKVNDQIQSGGDQMKIMSHLLKILAVQRISKHSMLLSQNEHRLKKKFLDKSTELTDVISIVCQTVLESIVQKQMIQNVQALLAKEERIKTNTITKAQISEDLKKAVNGHVKVKVVVCVTNHTFSLFLSVCFSIYFKNIYKYIYLYKYS